MNELLMFCAILTFRAIFIASTSLDVFSLGRSLYEMKSLTGSGKQEIETWTLLLMFDCPW